MDIRANRRDLNEFEGVTDPVAILKIIHKPRKLDPLINWLPHPTPTDEIYSRLTIPDQGQLSNYATKLIGSDRHDEAEEILLCLAAFTDANLAPCLRALVSANLFWPSLPFHRSPNDVRDALIDRVEIDDENRNHILLALSWIGDSDVVDLFNRWRCDPPAWRSALYIPPQHYSRSAGWELTASGERRNLHFEECTKLVPHPPSERNGFAALTDHDEHCPWCHRRLTNLFDVATSSFGLAAKDTTPSHIQVTTCEVCTEYGTIFGRIDDGDHGHWSPATSRFEYLPDESVEFERLPRNPLFPDGTRSTRFAADQFLPTTFSQIGGLPTWIQDEDYPQCPDCSRTMMFLAQIDHAEIEDYSEGTYYAFTCPMCRTTATNYQQT